MPWQRPSLNPLVVAGSPAATEAVCDLHPHAAPVRGSIDAEDSARAFYLILRMHFCEPLYEPHDPSQNIGMEHIRGPRSLFRPGILRAYGRGHVEGIDTPKVAEELRVSSTITTLRRRAHQGRSTELGRSGLASIHISCLLSVSS
ncbi:uncharacterized protein FIBRA_07213 [Fibroporia radiculosa]|uniref:Uncharacterized protein n=1 Tax=Fibroporia radiculosa TaxID=599839 RepID=J4H4H7_9APHY|nr:uncharacterized protein FIBRA_07213 [Fibroporia radiculosa]CCM05014.1 predicted protein [Fibroporia radiculosa]